MGTLVSLDEIEFFCLAFFHWTVLFYVQSTMKSNGANLTYMNHARSVYTTCLVSIRCFRPIRKINAKLRTCWKVFPISNIIWLATRGLNGLILIKFWLNRAQNDTGENAFMNKIRFYFEAIMDLGISGRSLERKSFPFWKRWVLLHFLASSRAL